MAFIKLFKFKDSTGLLKKEYEKGMRRAGRIWNILTIQSQTPEILRDSMRLYNSTMFGNLEISRFDSEYWIQAHLYDLRSETKDQKLVDEIANDWKKSSLTKEQIALCNFAEKLTLKPGEITQLDYKELQKNNFDDKAISEIVQVISYFNYINRVADGLGLEPEEFIDEKGYKK